jgi:hypothetical protein
VKELTSLSMLFRDPSHRLGMLRDPRPWLMAQQGLIAVRARRRLGIERDGDTETIHTLERRLLGEQQADGSFAHSPIKTAGVLNLIDDLQTAGSGPVVAAAASYLFAVLAAQPGYGRAGTVAPGSLQSPCDLCGFFGPYESRDRPDVLAWGTREMNYYREYEPLLGPKSPVRSERRSSRDRVGPGSCYAWGLIPLSYLTETLCRAGYARDERLHPAVSALLGAQRRSGGWCRNLGGHPNCTLHAVRALGAHPELRQGPYTERAIAFVHGCMPHARLNPFALLHVVAPFDLPAAREIARDTLAAVAPRQRANGTFGGPNPVERVAAVLAAVDALVQAEG